MSGGEYVPWFDNGNLFNETLLKYKCRSRKRGIKTAKKNIVLGIKQDQDPDWFKVIFSSDWMGPWAVFWWILGTRTRTKEQQQLKFLLLVQNTDQMRAASLDLQSNSLCVPPLLLYYHVLHCKATHGLLSVEDFGVCQQWAPGGNGLLYLSFLFSHGRNLCCITASYVL